MHFDEYLEAAKSNLARARELIQDEIRAYPTPISGCDAQYNYLIGERQKLSDALSTLQAEVFVATPRTPDPAAGVESR